MSKSSPTIFLDKKKNVKGVFGAAGGFFIPSCLTMVKLKAVYLKLKKVNYLMFPVSKQQSPL